MTSYTDNSCSTNKSCSKYYAVSDCIIDLYSGVNACQYIYILDSDGNPIDIERASKIDIMFFDDYGCPVMSNDKGITITNAQETYSGNLFEITNTNFESSRTKMFEVVNTRVGSTTYICPDDADTIIMGTSADDCILSGQIIFNPITYNGDLYIEVKPNSVNEGNAICYVNGIPQAITFNAKTKLLNVVANSENSVVSIVSTDANHNATIAKIDSIKFTDDAGIKYQGRLKLCYSGAYIPNYNTGLKAEIIIKFDENDVENGLTELISCVNIANVKKSLIMNATLPDDNNEEPIYNGALLRIADALPTASWNTMNCIYLIKNKNQTTTNEYVEYVTIRIKNNNQYSYYWEKLGDSFTLASSTGDTAEIHFTNKNEVDSKVEIKYADTTQEGSMIEFDSEGNAITAKITRISGAVL